MTNYYTAPIQPDGSFGTISIDPSYHHQNTITFAAGNPNVEMLKVSPEGFWVRGMKVEQNDKEAETVYNAFKAWMMWAKLNER
jgi:hypothetical protein